MKNEAEYIPKGFVRKKKKTRSYFLYDISDPFTKNLVKLKSHFKKNPCKYILVKLIFGALAILLPFMLVCHNAYCFLISENSNYSPIYKLPQAHILRNIYNNTSANSAPNNNYSKYNYSNFNPTQAEFDVNSTKVKYNNRKIYQKRRVLMNTDTIEKDRKTRDQIMITKAEENAALFNFTFKNQTNFLKSDKKIIAKYKHEFLILNNLKHYQHVENIFIELINEFEFDLLIPLKMALLFLILILLSYMFYKIYHIYFFSW